MMKTMDGSNIFRKENFEEMCKELESGERIAVYIDCIGHGRNNDTQDDYNNALNKKYGKQLEEKFIEGSFSYSYEYQLKKEAGN